MPTILITGAARGIGLAITERLAASGWDVIAGVRDERAADELRAPNVTPVILDITNPDQVAELDQVLPQRLDAVVNNAGIVVGGPVEALTPDQLRHQLDVNVIGQHAVTRAVLPRLRTSQGRIVFVSSISGRVATPMTGAYNASKFALEGMADALRMELAPWKIRVVLIEPGQTDTDIWRDAETTLESTVESMTTEHRTLYARQIAGYRKSIPLSQKLAVPADSVAASVETALRAKRPRARYVVGRANQVQAALVGAMPTALSDKVIRIVTGVPRRP
ncbi:SDR family oxidoreductase [Gordonia rubripertincta]|uniref:SDR family oxidoreductase n=1 Tax=Gordonia rubripertincta TaxID=36822 RepID=A0ABT4MTN2_GORRU|nr:SDR family oxidoreductase [Gordonia rubripertincta]MCZ4550340.1 SDR family oxidoreductase [Gordonia rubripertincta]